MYYGYLGYLLFMLPALLLGLYAQIMVKVNYSRYSKVISRSGLTGREAAERVLQMNGVGGVRIGRVGGTLTDHYDPRSNSINLSQGVYDSATVAAIGVAAHEAGHAVQYAKNYAPIKLRMAIIPVCNIGTRLGPLLIILGFFLSYMAESMRAGLQSVPQIQRENAYMLGFNTWQTLTRVIVPQAVSISTPGIVANVIFLIKESSVVSAIALADVMYMAKDLMGMYYNTYEALFMLIVTYLIILLPISILGTWLERRFDYARR